jgi:hypothetical protein
LRGREYILYRRRNLCIGEKIAIAGDRNLAR